MQNFPPQSEMASLFFAPETVTPQNPHGWRSSTLNPDGTTNHAKAQGHAYQLALRCRQQGVVAAIAWDGEGQGIGPAAAYGGDPTQWDSIDPVMALVLKQTFILLRYYGIVPGVLIRPTKLTKLPSGQWGQVDTGSFDHFIDKVQRSVALLGKVMVYMDSNPANDARYGASEYAKISTQLPGQMIIYEIGIPRVISGPTYVDGSNPNSWGHLLANDNPLFGWVVKMNKLDVSPNTGQLAIVQAAMASNSHGTILPMIEIL